MRSTRLARRCLLAVVLLLGLTAVGAPPSGAEGALCAVFVPRYAPLGGGVMAVVDPISSAVTSYIGIDPFPTAAAAMLGGPVYVTASDNNKVSVVDPSTNTFVASIDVGSNPSGIAVLGTTVYVTNNGSNSVSVIDGTSNTVTTTIPVGDGPNGIAAAPWNTVYVANEFDDTVSVIDVDPSSATFDSVIASIPVGDQPIGVAVSPSGRVFVSNQLDDTVSVIDRVTNAVTNTVAVGDAPLGMTWTASRGSTSLVYVANSLSDTVSVIDDSGSTPVVIATIAVDDTPVALAASPSGPVYVANYNSDRLSVIDPSTNTVSVSIDVGNTPVAVAVSGCIPPGISAVVADDGRSIQLSGTGFPTSIPVSVTLGSATVGTVTPRPDGSFDATVLDIDCAVTSGTLTVTAGWASATTTVALSPCSTPVVPVHTG